MNVMVRIGLTLYLTLVTAAGPGLCCCSLGRLFVSPSADTTAPLAPHTCCCGQYEAPSENPPAGDEYALDSHVPPPPDGPCSCREGRGDLSALATQIRPAGESGDPLAGLYPLESEKTFTASHLEPQDEGEVTGEPIAFPYYSPRGVLRALHILLC